MKYNINWTNSSRFVVMFALAFRSGLTSVYSGELYIALSKKFHEEVVA